MRGIRVVRDNYVKELNQGEMVGWAIRGLYRRLDEKVPEEIKERLDKAKDLKEPELEMLLADVRERLGKREDLDSNKDVDIALQMMMANLDPYTTYIDPETKRKAEIDIAASSPASASRSARTTPGRLLGRHADQGQPGLQGGPQGRRPDHRDRSARWTARASRCRRRRSSRPRAC